VLIAQGVERPHGLSASEAERRLAEVGSNDLRLERDLPLWRLGEVPLDNLSAGAAFS
jgi:hypothetical protein